MSEERVYITKLTRVSLSFQRAQRLRSPLSAVDCAVRLSGEEKGAAHGRACYLDQNCRIRSI